MAAPTYPLINGNFPDWSSVEIDLGGTIFTAIKEISYKSTTEPGEVYGTTAQKIGRTRGQNKPEASITFYLPDYNAFIKKLGNGHHEKVFDVTVNYNDPAGNIVTDKVLGCRIKDGDHSGSSGNEALVVKCDLDVMAIVENGQTPLINMKGVN